MLDNKLNDEIKEKQLLKINDITHKTYTNSNNKKYTLISIAIILLLFFSVYNFLYFKYISPINTAIKVGNIEVTNEEYDMMIEKLKNKKINNYNDYNLLVNKYFVDTIILSEKAKELGLTVTEEEINKQNEINYEYNKRVALIIKLKEYLKNNANITDDEIKNYYEKVKNILYVKKSKYEYYALVSDTPFSDNTKIDFSKYKKSIGTIKDLMRYGIINPQKGKWYDVDLNDGKFRRIYILDGQITYIPLEKVKDEIKKSLYIQKTNGLIQNILNEGKSKYEINYYK